MQREQQIGKIYVIKEVDPSESNSNSKRWYCQCECGNEIILTEGEIYSQHCAKACSQLRGEVCVADIFDELGVPYVAQMQFGEKLLTFDFYLPEQNMVIECDGAQHFRTQNNDWNSPFKLQETRHRDELKRQYCKEHDIQMIQIPFWNHEILNVDYLRSIL